MATTSPDNIWTPDSGDDYALTVDLAAMADTVQDAITANRVARVGTEAQRVSLTGADLFSGLRFYTTDTNLEWLYNGSTWGVSSGFLLGEATKPTSPQTITAPNTAPGTEVSDMAVNIVLPSAVTVEISAVLNTYSGSASDVLQLKLRDGTTDLRISTQPANSSPSVSGTSRAHYFFARVPLAAGTHRLNFAILRVVGSTGNVTIAADAATVNFFTVRAG